MVFSDAWASLEDDTQPYAAEIRKTRASFGTIFAVNTFNERMIPYLTTLVFGDSDSKLKI
jgi:hypothetical protein